MVRNRLKILVVLFTVPYLVILARLASLQLVEENHQRYLQLSLHRRRVLLPPPRGEVHSRDGKVLAGNQPVCHLHFRYPELNPRRVPLSVLVGHLRKVSEFPGYSEVEKRAVDLVDVDALTWQGAGAEDPRDVLLVDGVSAAAGKSLKSRLRRYSDMLALRPSEDGASWQVWFRPRKFLQMEIALARIADLLADPDGPAAARARLLGSVAKVLDRIEECVRKETEDFRKKGARLDLVKKKETNAREAYYKQSWLLAADVSPLVVTAIECRPELYPGIEVVDASRRHYPLKEASGSLAGYLRLPSAADLESLQEDDLLLEPFTSVESVEDFGQIRRRRADGKRKGEARIRSSDLLPAGGLEAFYDGELRGAYGMKIVTVDNLNRQTATGECLAPEDGADIRSSIDSTLQRLLYDALEERTRHYKPPEDQVLLDTPPEELLAILTERGPSGDETAAAAASSAVLSAAASGAPPAASVGATLQVVLHSALKEIARHRISEGGSAVVMEIPSGALLASVGFPGFDPNRISRRDYLFELGLRWGKDSGALHDRPSSLALYPGSVFKIAMAVAAMESATPWEGEFSPERRYACNYEFDLFPKIACGHKGGHTPDGRVNLVEALQYSCNNFFYWMGCKHLDPASITEWARALGYGELTGVDLPPSSLGRGRLLLVGGSARRRTIQEMCHYSIGQVHVKATPLQVARCAAAIALGGKSVPRPHIVRPTASADPLSLGNPRTAQAIREGMWRAGHAPGGTAYPELSRFNAGCKTGTAEVSKKLNNGWLVGFAPFDAPRIVFVVSLEKIPATTEGGDYGGEACRPVAEKILGYLAERDPEAYLVERAAGPPRRGGEP